MHSYSICVMKQYRAVPRSLNTGLKQVTTLQTQAQTGMLEWASFEHGLLESSLEKDRCCMEGH